VKTQLVDGLVKNSRVRGKANTFLCSTVSFASQIRAGDSMMSGVFIKEEAEKRALKCVEGGQMSREKRSSLIGEKGSKGARQYCELQFVEEFDKTLGDKSGNEAGVWDQ
jgi:hypothetical protein